MRKVESLDFDVLIGGHGPVGVKRDVTLALEYLEQLRAEVLAGLQAGKSSAQLQEEIRMEEFRNWENYNRWRALNIQGMARHLKESGAVQ